MGLNKGLILISCKFAPVPLHPVAPVHGDLWEHSILRLGNSHSHFQAGYPWKYLPKPNFNESNSCYQISMESKHFDQKVWHPTNGNAAKFRHAAGHPVHRHELDETGKHVFLCRSALSSKHVHVSRSRLFTPFGSVSFFRLSCTNIQPYLLT